MAEKGKSGSERKRYSGAMSTRKAVWRLLTQSQGKPLSIPDMMEIFKGRQTEEPVPSRQSLKRFFAEQDDELDTLFPMYSLQQKDKAGIVRSYWVNKKLHIILENADGIPLREGDAAVRLVIETPEAPSYETIRNTLSRFSDEDMESLAPVLRVGCAIRQKGPDGRLRFIELDKWDGPQSGKDKADNYTRYYYLKSILTDAQWRILADMIKVYPYLSETQTKSILQAMKKIYPGIKAWTPRYAYKTEGNARFFRHIRRIDIAIGKTRKIRVTYGEYVLRKKDGEWRPVLRRRTSAGVLEMEPYALMWSNGYYYLVAKDRGMMNLRVDRIIDVEILDEKFEPDRSFDPYEYRDKSPVMYPGQARYVTLRCPAGMVNTLLDVFGKNIRFGEPADGRVRVQIHAAPAGIKLFALQYADKVEVLEPAELRDEIRNALREALKSYQ